MCMFVNTNNFVTMREANQNFSKVARQVDERGTVVIMKNNKPRYILSDYNAASGIQYLENDEFQHLSERLIKENLEAYKELAK